MMLTSSDQIGDTERCRQLGVHSYLIKPIRRTELLNAISRALANPGFLPRRAAKTLDGVASSPATANTGSAAVAQTSPKLRILVAEDNPINQHLAMRLLQGEGHTVEIAPNGHEVVRLHAEARFDLILMDVQMTDLKPLAKSAQRSVQAESTSPSSP